MNRLVIFFLLGFLVFVGDKPAFPLDCPKMPEQINKDWQVEVNVAVGKIGPVKGGELRTRTNNATKDLLGRLPDAGKVYLEQMMYSAYCSALRDNKTIKESEKAKLLLEYNREVRRAITPSPATAPKPAMKHPKNEDRSKSVNELISLLDSRFENVIAEIDDIKKEPDKLRAYKDADETEKSLGKLHEQIKDSFKKGEFVKAHELINDFHDKLESFYTYPLIHDERPHRRYLVAPEPGQDKDYDEKTRALLLVHKSTSEKYPGPEIESFMATKTK